MNDYADWAPAAGGILLLIIVIACVWYRAPYSVEERKQAELFASVLSDLAWNAHFLAKNITTNYSLGLLLPYLGMRKEWSTLRTNTIGGMTDWLALIGNSPAPDAQPSHELRSAALAMLETQIGILKHDLTSFENIVEMEKVSEPEPNSSAEPAPPDTVSPRAALYEDIKRKQEVAEKRLREAGRKFAEYYDLEYSEPSPDDDEDT